MSNPEDLVGQTILRYKLVEFAGEGGTAFVFRGEHLDLQLPVAIKLLFPHQLRQTNARERFLREARLQFQLKHPNILRVLDLIDSPEHLGMVMDWVEGPDLARYIEKKQQPIPLDVCFRWFFCILDAVHHAHQQGIIHRDIKPGNILLEGKPGVEIPKLMDFGIARSLKNQSDLTRTGTVIGTPYYIAPEQARAEGTVDHRADVYALGGTLYHMLTGHYPYQGDNALQVVTSHCLEPVPRLDKYLSGFDPRLQTVIDKAMAKHPDDRFPHCEAFAQALHQVYTSAPIPTGSHAPLAMTSSRPSYWWIPLLFFFLTLVGCGVLVWRYTKVRQARQDRQARQRIQRAQRKIALPLQGKTALPRTHPPETTPPQTTQKPSKNKTITPTRQTLGTTPPSQTTPNPHPRQTPPLLRLPKSKRAQTASPRRKKATNIRRRREKQHLRLKHRRPVPPPRPAPTRVTPTKPSSLRPTPPPKTNVWERSRYQRCRSCVNQRYRRLWQSQVHGMTGIAGLVCNFNDFKRIGKQCATACARRYTYYCVAFLHQRFRRGMGVVMSSAGSIPSCKVYTRQYRALQSAYRGTASTTTSARCTRRWRTLGKR